MNEIEKRFYRTLKEYINDSDIHPQYVVGIYIVDFMINGILVVEIDGHESHKTKEQRETDYKRERYLLMKGYKIIRFTGTEIFLEADRCASEVSEYIDAIIDEQVIIERRGYTKGFVDGSVRSAFAFGCPFVVMEYSKMELSAKNLDDLIEKRYKHGKPLCVKST